MCGRLQELQAHNRLFDIHWRCIRENVCPTRSGKDQDIIWNRQDQAFFADWEDRLRGGAINMQRHLLRNGYTVVSAPLCHKVGKLERPSIWKLQIREDTLKDIVVQEITAVNDSAFRSLLAEAQNKQDAFIFVHGYNQTFEKAALRTAQLTQDLSLEITPIMYSWSSNGKVIDYPGDEDQVALGTLNFISFLKRVARDGKFKHLHLIAHSMGNRLICNALYELRNDTTNLRIDQVIMAAPDVFADQFEQKLASAIMDKAEHVTIYTARNDEAIRASKFFHHDVRLGQIGLPPPLYVLPGIDIIDATTQKMDLLGHGRFAQSPVILLDIETIFETDKSAALRNVLMRPIGTFKYYYFPK